MKLNPDSLAPLQRQILRDLERRGIRGAWLRVDGETRLYLAMWHQTRPASVYALFKDPRKLTGLSLHGWRQGTLEELKLVRPAVYECLTLAEPGRLASWQQYAAWTPIDWDGAPNHPDELPPAAARA